MVVPVQARRLELQDPRGTNRAPYRPRGDEVRLRSGNLVIPDFQEKPRAELL